MLSYLFLVALSLLPGIYLVYHYREKLGKYEGKILAFSVFVTTGLFILDILHPNISVYTVSGLENSFRIGGIALDTLLSSFLLTFLIGTCGTILRIELRQEKLDLTKQSKQM